MKRWLVTLALGAALLASGAVAAWANDTAIGGAGGTVEPLADDVITLEAETVQVIAYRRFAAYRVDFKFRNDGPAKTLLLGFPFPQGIEPESPHLPPASVRAWQGDTRLEVTMVKGTDGEEIVEYWTHEVDFPAGVTFVRVEYYAAPTVTAGGPPAGMTPPAPWQEFDSWMALYPYTVHTGAGWAGTIGKTVIRYTFTEDADAWGTEEMMAYQVENLASNESERARILGSYQMPLPGVFQWTFEDFEPTSAHDVGIHFLQPTRTVAERGGEPEGGRSPAAVVVTASSRLELGEFRYLPVNAADGYPSTAWAEGAEGPGIDEWLRFEFGTPRTVREVIVLPGYAKTSELFYKYNRPKTLHLEFSDGTGVDLPLEDEPVVQRFAVESEAEWIEVSIREVYPGTTRDETYLSEIEFAESAAPEFATFDEVMGLSPISEEETRPAEEPTSAPDVPETAEDGRWSGATWLLLGGLAVLAAVLVRSVGAKRARD
jgi:hypothetical protein